MSNKWKSNLVSSGLPLENEAIELLVEKGFNIEGEFPYTRFGFVEAIDGSIDIKANAYVPNEDNFNATVEVLIECKHRSNRKAWLFLDDPNDPDFSPARPDGIRYFSSFSTYAFDEKPLLDLNCEPPSAIKAMEINLENGGVQDKDIKHAANQIRYALPETTARNILVKGSCHPVDCWPFFILPIIVTNAELRLTKQGFNVHSVEMADSLDSFSEPVDWVDLYLDHTVAFETHCKKVFRTIALGYQISEFKSFSMLDEFVHKNHNRLSARSQIESLSFGHTLFPHSGMYKQFWVCNISALDTVITKALDAITQATANQSYKLEGIDQE